MKHRNWMVMLAIEVCDGKIERDLMVLDPN